MSNQNNPIDAIGDILTRAREAAIDYYRLTGKPLGITGEVGEYEAARLLHLSLADAREPGYDATSQSGVRYQIKSRSFSDAGRQKNQRLGHGAVDLDKRAHPG